MYGGFIAIPDADVPQVVELIFQHVLTTYSNETNKTVSVWRAVPDDLLSLLACSVVLCVVAAPVLGRGLRTTPRRPTAGVPAWGGEGISNLAP